METYSDSKKGKLGVVFWTYNSSTVDMEIEWVTQGLLGTIWAPESNLKGAPIFIGFTLSVCLFLSFSISLKHQEKVQKLTEGFRK